VIHVGFCPHLTFKVLIGLLGISISAVHVITCSGEATDAQGICYMVIYESRGSRPAWEVIRNDFKVFFGLTVNNLRRALKARPLEST
jgi:hypothetical protein